MFNPLLTGTHYRLEAVEKKHLEPLKTAASHKELWTYIKPKDEDLVPFIDTYIDALYTNHQKSDPYAYIVIHNQTNTICGTTRYYDIAPDNKRACIGYTWYHPDTWGTGINAEVKLLLLSQLLETLNWNRVAFHVDARNQRSIRAMTYLGATNEGTLRKHKIVQNTFVRDTALFSIIQEDWPKIKDNLIQRIDAISRK